MDDISIIDLDLKKTTWSRVHSSMRTLHLKLSAEPDLDWVRFFREERESRVVVKRHGLWIEDGYIVFDCLLADVETHHLPDFRKSVAFANVKWRELNAMRGKESRQRRDAERNEQQRLTALRDHVRDAASTQPPAMSVVPPARSANDGANAKFEAERKELRARFRAALKSRTKESARGND